MANYNYPLGTGLSADQTIVRAYDETNNRHRVDAQVTAVIGAVDVVIDAASGDNIAIRDSDGNELGINANGSINVIVQDIVLDYTNDSVTVYQGTIPWLVSAVDLDIRNLEFAQDKVDVTGSSVSVSNFPTSQSVVVTNEVEVKNTVGSPLTVSASDLDIRDLTFVQDKVDVSGSVVALDVFTLSALENVTVQNGSGAGAVNIQDGGNSITVDGSVSINNFPATQNVQVINEVEVKNDVGNPLFIQSTDLDIRNLNSTQDSVTTVQGTSPWVVSGSVTSTPSGIQDVNIVSSIEVEVKNDAGSPVPISDAGSSLTVDATDLDIRDLTFATDKIDTSGSVIALDSATLVALESTSTVNGALEVTQLQILNSKAIDKAYTSLKVDTKNDDGNPTQITIKNGLTVVRVLNISYDADGDFEELVKS